MNETAKKNHLNIRVIAMTAIPVAVIVLVYALLHMMWGNGRLIPPWVAWQNREEKFEINYLFRLTDKSLKILQLEGECEKEIYVTDPGYKISDFLITDVDGDGNKDLITLLWKKGRYGYAKPFWIEEDENTWSQHIFIYDIYLNETSANTEELSEKRLLRQKWCTSDIGRQVKRWRILDQSENVKFRKNPACSTILLEDTDKNISLWAWEGFGLRNQKSTVTFAAFGDLIIHDDMLNYGLYKKNGDYSYLFKDISTDINNADLCAINLESMLVDDDELYEGYPFFGAPIGVGKAISDAGIDIVTCANNHSLDKGPYGLKVTYDFFTEDKSVTCLGINVNEKDASNQPEKSNPAFLNKNGIRFALYNYTYGTNLPDKTEGIGVYDLNDVNEEQLRQDLAEGRDSADIVIVFVHWGNEYSNKPNEMQRKYARLFNECGVDVILGSHPHVIQPMEIIKGKDKHSTYVFYSLGNCKASQKEPGTNIGGEACFTVSYGFDNIEISDCRLKKINSYWR